MTSLTKLEIEGTLSEHPLAELLAEACEAKLSGSFRLSNAQHKIIIYLDDGEIVYAVSNNRHHRLFDILLRTNKIDKQQLTNVENIGNDLELGEELISQGLISQTELVKIGTQQVGDIIGTGLAWKTGDWFYSSLVRARAGIRFQVSVWSLMLKHARGLTPNYIFSRFRSEEEAFGLKPNLPAQLDIQSHEAFILSRFESLVLKLTEIDAISGLSDQITRLALYTLWLGGFLFRRDWNPVFTDQMISTILGAKIKLKEVEESDEPEAADIEAVVETPLPAEPEEPVKTREEEMIDEEKELLDYLHKIENASSLYEILDLNADANAADIKRAYFGRAKKYHPDLFHNQDEDGLHSRVQSAFTEIAHAYEILKEEKSRDLYDYKMRKELEKMRQQEESGATAEEIDIGQMAERSESNFEAGMSLMANGQLGESIPFFARAVHFSDGNAKYHAYYGKALSSSQNHLHKAEGELQTAIRIDPENTMYRLMLAELFEQIGLYKRAEGELKRLLAIAPEDAEALALLDSLQSK